MSKYKLLKNYILEAEAINFKFGGTRTDYYIENYDDITKAVKAPSYIKHGRFVVGIIPMIVDEKHEVYLSKLEKIDPPSSNSRRRGTYGENDCSAWINKNYGIATKRGESQAGTYGDTENPDVVGWPGIHIEVKFTKVPNVNQWLQQAIRSASATDIPVVFWRTNNSKWMITLREDDLQEFQRRYISAGGKTELKDVNLFINNEEVGTYTAIDRLAKKLSKSNEKFSYILCKSTVTMFAHLLPTLAVTDDYKSNKQ